MTKRCARCKQMKPIEEFHLHKRASSGRQSTCKICATALQREWRAANPSYKVDLARRTRKRKYAAMGVTEAQVEKDMKRGCFICKARQELDVDHDHVTGKYRGILCRAHNRGLGMFHDFKQELLAAINYLDQHC